MPVYNGVSLIDYGEWLEADSAISTDACLTGCGGICGNMYFHSRFPGFIEEQQLHISALELLAVVVGLKLWGQQMKGKRLVILCDNLASCIVINTGKAKCKFMQQCMREISYLAAVNEFQLRALHIEGRSNRLPDSLSRWHLNESHEKEFMKLTGGMHGWNEVVVDEQKFQFSHEW